MTLFDENDTFWRINTRNDTFLRIPTVSRSRMLKTSVVPQWCHSGVDCGVIKSGGFEQNGYLDSLTVTERSLVNTARWHTRRATLQTGWGTGCGVPGVWGTGSRSITAPHPWYGSGLTSPHCFPTVALLATVGSCPGHRRVHFWSILVNFGSFLVNFRRFSVIFRDFQWFSVFLHVWTRLVDTADRSCQNPYPILEEMSVFAKKWCLLDPVFVKVQWCSGVQTPIQS